MGVTLQKFVTHLYWQRNYDYNEIIKYLLKRFNIKVTKAQIDAMAYRGLEK